MGTNLYDGNEIVMVTEGLCRDMYNEKDDIRAENFVLHTVYKQAAA